MRMHFKWRHGWVVMLLLAAAAGAVAQRVFPVQGTLVLTPPYSPYLSDLTAAGSQRLLFQVRVTDPTVPQYTCRFRIRIDGAGISLFTRPEFIGPPLVLPGGGVVQLLFGDELAEYFRPANLIFQGITQRDYERSNRLPEGVYRFTLEVLDYNRGTAVSNAATATAWMVLNDPPLLNLPRQLARLPQQEPTNIAFLWTPCHTASVNAAFTTEYYFKLVELPPSVTNAPFPAPPEGGRGEVWIDAANQAMLAQPPIFQITTSQSALVYGPGEPALIPGRLYAWQVQARDTESRDLFKNLGRSEVFVFQYGEALGMPENVQSGQQTPTGLMLDWEPPLQGDMPERYRISYKPDYADRWYEITTANRWFNLGDLRPDARVQVKLRAEKGSQSSAYTPVVVLRTAPESSAFQCGAPAPPPATGPANPNERLFKLLPGDRLTINRSTILMATAEGSGGQFTGTGWMKIPAFNGVGVRVRFRGSVNTNYALDGEAVTIASGGNWASNLIEEMEKIGEERRKTEEAGRPTAVEITIAVAGVIDSVYVNPAGDIVVLKEDGSEQTVPRPTASANAATPAGGVPPVVLQDEAGNRYRVEKDEKTGETKVNPLARVCNACFS